jgi:hypothetical protein
MTVDEQRYRWIGRGVYTFAEAARITGVSPGRIRRWMRGYSFVRGIERRLSPPVIGSDGASAEESEAGLSFRDLIEVMCVHGFLVGGVRWPILRRVHDKAAQILHTRHPFATRQFLTDGHSVLLRVGEKALLDLVSNQYTLLALIRPFLKTDGLDFVDDFAARWWPLGKRTPVLIDAGRSFGQPIVIEGVPTSLLFRAYGSEFKAARGALSSVRDFEEEAAPDAAASAIRRVATWYAIPVKSVRAAVDYEDRLAA